MAAGPAGSQTLRVPVTVARAMWLVAQWTTAGVRARSSSMTRCVASPVARKARPGKLDPHGRLEIRFAPHAREQPSRHRALLIPVEQHLLDCGTYPPTRHDAEIPGRPFTRARARTATERPPVHLDRLFGPYSLVPCRPPPPSPLPVCPSQDRPEACKSAASDVQSVACGYPRQHPQRQRLASHFKQRSSTTA